MDEKTAKALLDIIETLRDMSFDINFCLEILKQDKKIADFYEKCLKQYEEQKDLNKKGGE